MGIGHTKSGVLHSSRPRKHSKRDELFIPLLTVAKLSTRRSTKTLSLTRVPGIGSRGQQQQHQPMRLVSNPGGSNAFEIQLTGPFFVVNNAALTGQTNKHATSSRLFFFFPLLFVHRVHPPPSLDSSSSRSIVTLFIGELVGCVSFFGYFQIKSKRKKKITGIKWK